MFAKYSLQYKPLQVSFTYLEEIKLTKKDPNPP
jgi:hypothetical protein